MTTKNTIKGSWVIGYILLFIILLILPFFTDLKNYNPMYLPYEEKTITIPIYDAESKYELVVEIPRKEQDNFEVKVYDKNDRLIEPFNKNAYRGGATGDNGPEAGPYYYSFMNVKDSGITISIKNKTNHTIFANTEAYTRVGESWFYYY